MNKKDFINQIPSVERYVTFLIKEAILLDFMEEFNKSDPKDEDSISNLFQRLLSNILTAYSAYLKACGSIDKKEDECSKCVENIKNALNLMSKLSDKYPYLKQNEHFKELNTIIGDINDKVTNISSIKDPSHDLNPECPTSSKLR